MSRLGLDFGGKARGDRVRKMIADHLGADESKCVNEASLRDDLGADSLDRVELAMVFEEEFDIEIGDDALEKIRTVGDAIAAVVKALA